MKLKEIANQLDVELRGSGEVEIYGPAGIEFAGPDEITFVSNPKYLAHLESTKAGAVILAPDAPDIGIPSLRSPNPYLTFAHVIELFYESPRTVPGIHPTSSVHDSAGIGENSSVGANVVISEGVTIGDRAVLHPGVVIYPFAHIGDDFVAHGGAQVREYCRIGDRVILQNGAIIGSEGFGFAPRGDGSYEKIIQSGIVVIKDDVEIGACTCIDRATVGETQIGSGTKIDNLVQIGHGSTIGENTILAAQVGLAGSTQVGDRAMLLGQVGSSGHIKIGNDSKVVAQSGLVKDVPEGTVVAGSPEMEFGLWKRNYMILRKLPQLLKRLRKLEKKLEE